MGTIVLTAGGRPSPVVGYPRVAAQMKKHMREADNPTLGKAYPSSCLPVGFFIAVDSCAEIPVLIPMLIPMLKFLC